MYRLWFVLNFFAVKKFLYVFLIIAFSSYDPVLLSQENCKVLKPEISGKYKGECRKNLANGYGTAIGVDVYEGDFRNGLPEGKGVYMWSTGEYYRGDWKKGKRNGIGYYRFRYYDRDSIMYGKWSNDVFTGPVEFKRYEINVKSGIDRYTFKKKSEVKDRVLIITYQNGMYNTGITNFLISSSSGYETSRGQYIGFEGVKYPVTIKVTYTTWNKLRTAQYYVEFDFTINEPGDWEVDLHN